MLEIVDASVGYGNRLVVQGVSLQLAAGEIGCLLGPSGCGKTTLLRTVAGFEPLRAGRIHIGGVAVASDTAHLPTPRRGIGMVFQEHALFPHLDVAGNVAFGLRELPSTERRGRVDTLLELVGLAGLGPRWPHELSGGQQQRVALARALAPRPPLLLLDEPFSNLDTRLREGIAHEVRTILRRAGTTALMVTHDQREAFALADRVGVMVQGRLPQWGTAQAVYRSPATAEVARFVGEGVLLPLVPAAGGGWTTAVGPAPAQLPLLQAEGGAAVLLRPEAVRLDAASPLRAVVLDGVFRGDTWLLTLRLAEGSTLLARGEDGPGLAPGAEVGVCISWPSAASVA